MVSTREAAFPNDLELLTQIANELAIAVENAVAFRQIEELKGKLSEEKLYLDEEIRTSSATSNELIARAIHNLRAGDAAARLGLKWTILQILVAEADWPAGGMTSQIGAGRSVHRDHICVSRY